MFLEIRLFRGLAAAWSRLALTIAIQLFTVPILLTYWNSDKLGAWLVLQAFFALLCLPDQCYHNYLENEFIKVHNVSLGSFSSLLRQAFQISRFLSFFQLASAIYICFDRTISRQYEPGQLGTVFETPVEIVVLFSCCNWMFFGNRVSVLSKALIACGHFDVVTWWGVLYQFLPTLVYCTAPLLGGGVLETGVFYVATQTTINVIALHYLGKRLPNAFYIQNEEIDGISISQHARALISAFQVAADALKLQGVRLIIGINEGLGDIATFNSMRTISNFGTQMLTVLTSPLTPHFSRYIANGDLSNTHKVFHFTNLFVLLAISPVSILVAGHGEWLFSAWTRGKLEFSPKLLGIFLIGVIANSLLSTFTMVIKGFNLVWVAFFSTLVSLIFMTVGLFLSGRSGSIENVALSVFVGDLSSGFISFVCAIAYLKKMRIHGIFYPILWMSLHCVCTCLAIFFLSKGGAFCDLSLLTTYFVMLSSLFAYVYVASVQVQGNR
jgi:hypothetical protein